MCYKAGHDCLAALKFVPDWFVNSKMIKIIFTALYTDETQMKIYSTLMKILVMSYLFVMGWEFVL